jgi:hypothetical protein
VSTLRAWPLLFGRGPTAEYGPIVVPEFLARQSAASLLSVIAGDAGVTPAGHAVVRRVSSDRLGPLLVIFRVVEPRQRDAQPAGSQPDELLTDQWRRPLTLVAGAGLRAEEPVDEQAAAAVLAAAAAALAPAFRAFWAADSAAPPHEAGPLLVDTTPRAARPPAAGQAGSGLDPGGITQLDRLADLGWEPPVRLAAAAVAASDGRAAADDEPWVPPLETGGSPWRRYLLSAVVGAAVVGAAIAAVVVATTGSGLPPRRPSPSTPTCRAASGSTPARRRGPVPRGLFPWAGRSGSPA